MTAWLRRLACRLNTLNARVTAKQAEVRRDIHDDYVAGRIWEGRIR